MLTQLLALVLLVGLTTTTLMLCFEKWGWLAAWEVKRPQWLMKRCDLCAGYWLCVVLLLLIIGAYLRLGATGITFEASELGFFFQAVPLYSRLLLHLPLPLWSGFLLAFPLALPGAAISRVLVGLSTGR